MILHSFPKQAAIYWFDRRHLHSFFPAKTKAPAAPNFGRTPHLGHRLAGPSSGLRGCAWSQREPRTPARFLPVRTVCLAALMTLSVVSFSFVASAGETTSIGAAGNNTWAFYIAEASQRFSVPAQWIRAVMQLESHGDTSAVSPKGAMGLMQVMPETYAELRLRYHFGDDPYEPRNNILAGTAYLREMRDRYGPGGFLAAYNAGPTRYEGFLARGRPLPEETHHYVAALAPIIGVPELPRRPENTPVTSPSPTFVAAHDQGSQLTARSENRFTPRMSSFENRPGTRNGTLFATIHVAFEQTLASARTVDMTALDPSANRALSTISASGEHATDRILKAAQGSLEPGGNALFAVRSADSRK